VEEQSAATKEIANSIAQASQGIQEVNQSSTAASEIANSSDLMKIRADDLKDMAEELNTIVGSFNI
jgi:methyl-accepting chemotaxis protein